MRDGYFFLQEVEDRPYVFKWNNLFLKQLRYNVDGTVSVEDADTGELLWHGHPDPQDEEVVQSAGDGAGGALVLLRELRPGAAQLFLENGQASATLGGAPSATRWGAADSMALMISKPPQPYDHGAEVFLVGLSGHLCDCSFAHRVLGNPTRACSCSKHTARHAMRVCIPSKNEKAA